MDNVMYGMFRGKDVQKNWRAGYYFAKPILEKHFILLGDEQWMVDKNTIGMCSCVPDNHGKILFEGDIVTYPWCNTSWLSDKEAMKFVVRFVDGEFRMVPVATHCKGCGENYLPCKVWDIRLSGESSKIQCIGNIHDNPDLIEV